MRRTHALATLSAASAVGLLAVPSSTSAWTGDAYADGFIQRSNGTGAAAGTVDADPDGSVELTASSVGGTRFLIPILNQVPYSQPTTVNGQSYVSDGVATFPEVEAGHDYRVTVFYNDLDLESSETGNGVAVAAIFAQASAGSDSSGHTLIAGSGSDDVTEDGDAVLEFDVHVTQDSPIGVQAGIRVGTSANGTGNDASVELAGQVTDVQVVELG